MLFYAATGGRPLGLVLGRGSAERHLEIAALLVGRDDVEVLRIDDDDARDVFGVTQSASTVLVLDPNLRVVGEVAEGEPAAEVVSMLDEARYTPRPLQVRDQAPVLFVPRVLDAEQRLRLVEVSQSRGDVETGVERTTARSRGEVLDETFKRRRDHTVRDAALLRELSGSIGRGVIPEIRKAFLGFSR